MDATQNSQGEYNSQRATVGASISDTLEESRKWRVVIRNREGKQVVDCSILLALILSIGAPIIPAFVVLGILVEAIQVSIEKRERI